MDAAINHWKNAVISERVVVATATAIRKHLRLGR